MRIWLEANQQAHDFISPDYWQENYKTVRELLPQAEVYIYETAPSEIKGFIGLLENYIAGIFVDKAARSTGIGKRLLEHAKEKKKELTLHVYAKNEGAVQFYLREGFQIREKKVDADTGAEEFLMVWSAD
ncbi:MAG: GNAT family N-acetyltransferase [Lachnospiraceae bacterium]|nr:GNAT family N-acetyltransferase [Lachnospiraceae bacterium]